jgi:hypothetical protein
MNSAWTVIRIESRELQSNDYGSPVRRRCTGKVRVIVHNKLLRSLRPSNLVGEGMPERIRAIGFSFLGLTAAAGLALVAIFAQTGFPLLSPAPLPSAPAEPSSVSRGVALEQGSSTAGLAQAPGAVTVPRPSGQGDDSSAAAGANGNARVGGSDDLVSGSAPGNSPGASEPAPTTPPATSPAPAPTTTAPPPTNTESTPASVETPVSSPDTGTKPSKSTAVSSKPDKGNAKPAKTEAKPAKTKPAKPKSKPAKPAKPEAKPAKPEAAPAPEASYVPAPAPDPVDKAQENEEKKNKGK